MKCAYVRVSTAEQNEERQIEALKKYEIEKWFTEKVSGKTRHRPQLEMLLNFVREGDTIYVHDFSRLARSTKDLLEIIEELQSKGVTLISNKENLDTSTPTGKLMITVIAAINEFELANLHERQREGIEIAKSKGKYAGRKKIKVDKEAWESCRARYYGRTLSKSKWAKELGISRPTLDKLIEEYDNGIDIFE